METLFSNFLTSLGLSSAAGLNAYVPLLAVGLLDRVGWLHLGPQYDWLSSPWTLGIVALIALLDFVGDKVPGIDHLLHTLGGWVNPVAGAIVFASQHGFGDANGTLSLVAGFVVAGGFHATRTALRPVATATTAGLGNPVVSFFEDVTSVVLSALAIFAPLLVVVALALLVWAALSLRGRWRRRRAL